MIMQIMKKLFTDHDVRLCCRVEKLMLMFMPEKTMAADLVAAGW